MWTYPQHSCGWSLIVVFSMHLQAWSRTAHTSHIYTHSLVSLFEHLCVSQCVVACILTMFACLWCACRQMVGQMSGLPREAPCGFFPGQLNVCPVTSDTILEHLATMQLIRPPWTKPSYRSVQEWCRWHVTTCIVAWTYVLYVAKPTGELPALRTVMQFIASAHIRTPVVLIAARMFIHLCFWITALSNVELKHK